MRTDTVTALADAEPRVYWLDTPDAAGVAAGAAGDQPAPTSPSSVAVSPGCGPRCWPRSATPAATWSCSRATGRLGRQRSQRRLLRGEPHPRRGQRPRALPARVPDPGADGPGEPRRDRGDGGPLRHRLRLPPHREPGRGDRGPPGRPGCRSSPPAAAATSWTEAAVRAEVALSDVPGGDAGTARHRPGRPRRPGVGAGRGGRGGRRAGARAHARSSRRAVRRGAGAADRERADGAAPTGWRWAPTPSRPCCGGCGCTRSRCTTTS